MGSFADTKAGICNGPLRLSSSDIGIGRRNACTERAQASAFTPSIGNGSIVQDQPSRMEEKTIAPLSVLITGASNGLGAALALALAERHRGSQRPLLLALLGRDLERLDEIALGCKEMGAEVVIKSVDVTDHSRMSSVLTALDEEVQGFDFVFASAGVNGASAFAELRPLAEAPGIAGEDEDGVDPKKLARAYSMALTSCLGVNVLGAANTVLPLLQKMEERHAILETVV